MKKELTGQDKKVDEPDVKRIRRLIMIIVECSFLAFTFSIIALLLKGISTIFVITLALSIITLLFALVERHKINAKSQKD
jgi:drug/metabolite transporter (DMT)-like permease